MSTLIHEFRELAEQAGEVATPVVIAIDELDKMSSADEVRALLRDIKGIFEVPGVHFLVSVSYEAIRTLRLGAITRRDEFSSSFYTVLELVPLSPHDCERLLWRRWVLAERAAMREDVTDEDVARALKVSDTTVGSRTGPFEPLLPPGALARYSPRLGVLLGILTGGVPREVVRLADIAEGLNASDQLDLEKKCVATLLRAEVVEFRRQVVGSLDGDGGLASVGDDERIGVEQAALGVFEALAEDRFAASSPWSSGVLEQAMWTPPWSGPWWERNFAEEWRRLLIRLHVGELLLSDRQTLDRADQAQALQAVISTASQSATFARLMIENSDAAGRPSPLASERERVSTAFSRAMKLLFNREA